MLSAVRSKMVAPMIVFSCTSLFLANFFFQEKLIFFYFKATTASHYIAAVMLAHFLAHEFHGKNKAIEGLFISFFFSIFLLVMAQFHLVYLPAPCDAAHWAYKETFTKSLHVFTPSLIIFFGIQLCGIWLWGYLQTTKWALWIRTFICALSLQLLDTGLFVLSQPSPQLELIIGIYIQKILAFILLIPVIISIQGNKQEKSVLS